MNSAALTVLAEAGIVGIEAEVALRHILAELAAPSVQTRQILDAAGLDRRELDPSIRSTSSILHLLASVDLNHDQIEALFGDEFTSAASALLAGVDRLKQLGSPG